MEDASAQLLFHLARLWPGLAYLQGAVFNTAPWRSLLSVVPVTESFDLVIDAERLVLVGGDAVRVLPLLGAGSVDTVVTYPPFKAGCVDARVRIRAYTRELLRAAVR
jgi:hypothetical protein